MSRPQGFPADCRWDEHPGSHGTRDWYCSKHHYWLDRHPGKMPTEATVILFKDSGKYYTEETWPIPADAVGPWDMERSTGFRRIGGGAVLVPDQEPWGYPFLLMPEGEALRALVRRADSDREVTG